ncbi:hypothetical protein VP01_1544g1 [Puccinia sorghi]|uniref:Uncharacterized protein n=1 Tax=Puccinia sorghi TaxID=27349 RepID=A0A0L6VI94_9BASI|nr:hypothetical protein VP01_1544g1 [Puccinia sorghi]
MFNDVLYIKFQEDSVEKFVTNTKVAIKKLVNVGIKFPQDILRQIVHSDKELNAKTKDATTTTFNVALFSKKGKSGKSAGGEKSGNQQNPLNRCKSGYNNPKQDENHSSDNCWHLHPDKVPECWASAHIFNDSRFFMMFQHGNFIMVQLRWKNSTIELKNCFYVPDIVIKLISAGELNKKKCYLWAKDSEFCMSKNGQVVLRETITNSL